jgi:development and cell death domain-containing protein
MIPIYIFECSDETQFECFERSLFGARAAWPLSVRTGDLCFLFNYWGKQKLIFGVYESVCNGQRDIVPSAWNQKYPCQVRVRLCSRERLAVPRANINRIVTDPQTMRVRKRRTQPQR